MFAIFCLTNDLVRSQKGPGLTVHSLVLTLVPGGHCDQGVHAVAGGVVGAVRVLGPGPRPRQQPHLGKKMISKRYKSYKTLFTVTARMTETRMTVRTQQRPTTRTLVKWAWRKFKLRNRQ